MSKNTRNRILLTAVAALLLVVVAIGGTVAYLQDYTPTVSNTFSPAGIDIDLYETYHPTDDTLDQDHYTGWEAHLVPGAEYRKNPVVTVDDDATDVEIYLFVKFEEVKNVDDYLDYTSTLTAANGWTELVTEEPTEDGTVVSVWYRTVAADATGSEWYLLEDDKVTVKDITKDLTDDEGMALKWTAYAIQTENLKDASGAEITDMMEIYELAGGNTDPTV